MLALAPSAEAASGGGCQLKGSASFSPGLSTTAQPFEYSFNGALSNCQASQAGSPGSGTVSAGEVYTDAATGNQYQLPKSQGNGSCASSTTSGAALITWADGTLTIIDYTTTGAAAAVSLEGAVRGSITLTPIDPLDPALTLTTTRYAGNSARGGLAFEASPEQCLTGVASAGIEGIVGLGTSS